VDFDERFLAALGVAPVVEDGDRAALQSDYSHR
jgi:hypothetical protein